MHTHTSLWFRRSALAILAAGTLLQSGCFPNDYLSTLGVSVITSAVTSLTAALVQQAVLA